MKYLLLFLFSLFCTVNMYSNEKVGLTLIPPGKISNKINLDIRGGIVNRGNSLQTYQVSLFWDKEKKSALLCDTTLKISSSKSDVVKIMNQEINKMTDDHWREMIRSMHKIEMDMVVIQEVFRHQAYIGSSTTVEDYPGKAFYPSKLYPGRMDIAAEDPIEAILSEADKQGMQVLMGVGMFAWFDFTPESLEWHKRVAKELWDMYGHHESFYAFYVSEESGGGLNNWEPDPQRSKERKVEIVHFFKEFKEFCSALAPEKPIMLATNSFDVPVGMDTYPELLKYLDILCPFGFARMPATDISGKEAADLLQKVCDEANAHLWFDLEAFLFNPDNSLYPRPIEQIIHDLNLFDNFEKILCYQFPGVFNDPEMSIRVGEARTINLFNGYMRYLKELKYRNKTRK